MKKYRKSIILLFVFFCIFILALFLRTYKLSSVPPNAHIDEASFGYNAYSIMLTGKDEYGIPLPFTLRSYDDYRPALLSYLMIPFIKLFGLTIFSIRLPSVLFSIVTLIGIYKIIIRLLSLRNIERKMKITDNAKIYIGFCSIFLYAISPWSVFVSRLAIEANVSLAFFVIGLVLFLDYVYITRAYRLYASFIAFVFAFYAYHGIKLFLPIFLFTLIVIFYKNFLAQKKHFVIALVMFIMLIMPFIFTLKNTVNVSRFNELNIFTLSKDSLLQISSKRLLYDAQYNDVLGKVFDNRRFIDIPVFISNYFSNLNPAWLYADDSHVLYKVPDFGLFYVFEFILFMIGIYFMISQKVYERRIYFLFLAWFFLSIIPAVFTYNTPNAVRIYTILPVFLIIEGLGLYALIEYIFRFKHLFIKTVLCVVSISVIAVSILSFFHLYFFTFPHERSELYQYGVIDAFRFAKQHESEYDHILISNQGSLGFSYIYYLFFTHYNPRKYLQTGGTVSGNFFANHVIGKYSFVNPNIYADKNVVKIMQPQFFGKHTLYILEYNDLPKNEALLDMIFQKLSLVKKINYLDGTTAILILAPK